MPQTIKFNNSSYLELFLGPMFSGKTSKLIEIYNDCQILNLPVVAINFNEDNRYGTNDTTLSSHNLNTIPCASAGEELYELYNPEGFNIENINDKIEKGEKIPVNQQISCAKVILINEAQFFTDLDKWVINMLNTAIKPSIFIAGLDGDFNKEKFGKILDLIPHCDKVSKLSAVCNNCNNNQKAIFSHRKHNSSQSQKVIGHSNLYKAVCRNCFNILSPQNNYFT